MNLFDKRFVYLEWNDKLKGKEVFVGDTLPQLRDFVSRNYNSLPTVSKNVCDDTNYPFISSSGMQYAMAYYDPNYSCKRAYVQGKVIQYRNKDSSDPWKDCSEEPYWTEVCEYRVKPDESEDSHEKAKMRRMTNRELAKWLAEGNGQACDMRTKFTESNHVYYGGDSDLVKDFWKIRGWDETEWHEPEVEE